MKQTKPLGLDTILNDYFPLPRSVLDLPLSASSMLLYAVLLDRGTLSQKNGCTDKAGQVYVIYTIEHLAETMHRGDTSVKRCLNELEKAGLIRRVRCGMNIPSRIFLSIPTASFQTVTGDEKRLSDGPKTDRLTVRKGTTNNRREQQKNNNLYEQYCEEESL